MGSEGETFHAERNQGHSRNARRASLIHLIFEIGVIAKGIDGALELIGGRLLVALSPAVTSANGEQLPQYLRCFLGSGRPHRAHARMVSMKPSPLVCRSQHRIDARQTLAHGCA